MYILYKNKTNDQEDFCKSYLAHVLDLAFLFYKRIINIY